MAETLEETRARFRKEFPEEAETLDEYNYWTEADWHVLNDAKGKWRAFAVGAGHGHDARFKEG